MKSFATHLSALSVLGLLTLLFTWPLARLVASGAAAAVLGAEPGDNFSVVWNFWWVRTAMVSPDQSLFWTAHLFAPIGTSLATHTLTPLVAASTAAALPASAPLTQYNVALACAVFLNMACAYAAAHMITRDARASLVAGVIFGGSPVLLIRLYGHLNLLSAWVLPSMLIATLRYERRPGWTSGLLLGAAAGLTAYVDYYYLIFGTALIAAHLLLSRRALRIAPRPLTSARRRALLAIVAVASLIGAVGAWIALTGGVDTTIAGMRVRMTETFNARVALGFLAVAAAFVWKRPVVTAVPQPDPRHGVWRFMAVAAGAASLIMSPVLIAAVQLWRAGDYASQVYFWRSAPPGIDLATLVLGNPLGALTGGWTTDVLRRLAINRMENAAWIGIVPLVLLFLAVRRRREHPGVQAYLWIGALFFVWSLGPYLRVLGYNTAVMLPQTFLRFVPIVANARIPGRAVVVVLLMIAMVGAIVLASLRRSRRGEVLAAIALIGVVVDFWPAPHPWIAADRPHLYETVKTLPSGVVLEAPLGIADGLGSRGLLGTHALFYQTIHEHPLMGGYLSRISPRTRAAYETDPIVGSLLDLSEGLPGTGPRACDGSLACAVRYVVVNEGSASDPLQRFLTASFALTLVERDGSRVLYRVDGVPACACGAADARRVTP